MEDPKKVLTKEQLTQELNSQQWLKQQALKNQDKILGAALNTRVDVLEQKATEFANLETCINYTERNTNMPCLWMPSISLRWRKFMTTRMKKT